ncbi:serine/arginine-rich splicing factor 5 [Exaiptasia diaphana]|uniref:RRM domain-containing protein n=1 Tax=Exaiptasia diaphana TaxID=2652724 RepID=A0A913XGF3_EXADI|nr:serine/arginine-rich splicing factor 5 [Exaiptasia diaphana]XP_020904028.1 serine/arginine-rich splicing factor 5 [Exaiptasia diaphana]KXJ12275.1 Serine/arginine-rich splicing factor 4 [Exaiptasia diaphana]
MSRGGTRVYFGRLPRDCRERDLEKFIRGYGHYREISIKLGYGFVEFEDSKDADDCVYDLNGKELLGERIVVEHARNPVRSVDYGYRSRDSSGYSSSRSSRRDPPRRGRTPPVRTEHRLAVTNLSSRCNWQDLKEYMSKAGEVTFADAHKRRQGEGVVEFSSKDDMKTAMKKLDDTEFFGRHIKLKIEKVKTRRSTSRSRSRSRSPRSRRKSRSRSRSRSPKRRRRSSSPHRRSKHSRSRSTSKSPSKDKKATSKSRSKSPDERSRSGSPKKDQENGDDDMKDVDEVDDEQEEQADPVQENGDDENGEEQENADDDDADKKDIDADDDGDDA